MTSAVILGMIVTMFPKPSEQAKAIGVYSFVAAAGGAVGLLAGGVLTQAHQLALDLLRQPPDRDRHRRLRDAAAPHDPGIGLDKGADAPGAVLLVERADARRLHDRRGRRLRLGLGAHARLRRGRRGAAGRLRRPPGHARPTR